MLKQSLTASLLGLLVAAGAAPAENLGQWGVRALNIQSSLDHDAPFSSVTWVGTHNSYANSDDDNIINEVKNQSMAIKKQLRAGVRELVFDVHYRSDAVRLCHDNTSLGACIDGITGNRKIQRALEDVVEWLNEGNRDQVVIIKLELAKSARQNINKVHKKLDNIINEYYMPSSMSTHGQLGGSGCTQLPAELTKSKVLASGKNVVLLTSHSCRSNGTFNDMVFYSGTAMEDFKNANDVANAPVNTITRVKDGATKGTSGSVKLQPSTVGSYLDAGLNIFEMYGFDADGSDWEKDGELPLAPEHLVWSWDTAYNEPNYNGHCALLNESSNRFRDNSCSLSFHAACRRLVNADGSRASSDWMLTSQAVTWDQAEQQCLLDGAGEYLFATPRNKPELDALVNARNSSVGDKKLWLNYRFDGQRWQADIGEADAELTAHCQTGGSSAACTYRYTYLRKVDASAL